MIVVSDTSPLNYLVLTECEEVLHTLFNEVFVPPAVIEELAHERSPQHIRAWAAALPAWLCVRAPKGPSTDLGLDLGESQAIALAIELRADALLVDDERARRTARRLGLQPRGTLAVLELAAERGLLDLNVCLDRLLRTNFRAPPARIAELRKRGPHKP
jgi:predicted nucleic acid-binding protein